MAKAKTVFFCKECGYESSGWLGKCPGCGQWNTFVEEKISKEPELKGRGTSKSTPMPVCEIKAGKEHRFPTGIGELDRVLGGGVVEGSLILAAGEPGIGKSTLMLMMAEKLSLENKVLYVSGEESAAQIKMRAERLGCTSKNLLVVSETLYSAVEEMAMEIKPSFLIIDSVQTLYDESMTSSPGSVGQVREITGSLMRLAKSTGISVFIIGHVTKDGNIAGPRMLEHMVDTVLYFEGERHLSYRILRGVKNRFGSTNEIGVFEMRDTGLMEVPNPSVAMLASRPKNVPGTAVMCTLEGSRPMLLEVQALVARSDAQMPRRTATGVDYNRMHMLLAVLEKRCGIPFGRSEVYINMTGGIKVSEPACDLGIAMALISSSANVNIDSNIAVAGEIGLTGEIRGVSHIEQRIAEAFRLGFTRCIVPEGNREQATNFMKQWKDKDCSIDFVRTVNDCMEEVFGIK